MTATAPPKQFGIDTALTVRAEGGKVAARQGVIDLAGSYRVLDVPLGSSTKSAVRFPRVVLAPYLGLRTNILWQELEVDTLRIGLTTGGTLLCRLAAKYRAAADLADRWM